MSKRVGEELLDARSSQTQSAFVRRVIIIVREEIAAQGISGDSLARQLEDSEEKVAEILDSDDISFPMMAKLCLAVGLEPGPALSERLDAVDIGD